MTLRALTREISPAITRCELTHLAREPIDLVRARAEHAAYEAALRSLGYDVERLPAGHDQPDSVFIEDTAVVLDELAVITRPGASSRRSETSAVADALRRYRDVEEMRAPATLDGGDVIRAGRRLLIGVGRRTNAAGATALEALCAPHGYEVLRVVFHHCLHLKTAATLVAEDLVLVNPAWVDVACFAPLRTLAVHPAEPFAANALLVGTAVIHAEDYARTRERLEAAGIPALAVPAGELAKAEGGVTCCSLVFDTMT